MRTGTRNLGRWRRTPRERGAATIEFALIVPLVLMLLLGTVTTSLVYADHLAVTNAVREGARYGAVADMSSSSWASSVQTRVQQVYFNANGTSPSDNDICVKLLDSSGNTLASDSGTNCGTQPSTPSNMAAGSCVVLVWMQHAETIQLVVFPDLTLNVGGKAVSYYSRSVTGTSCTAS